MQENHVVIAKVAALVVLALAGAVYVYAYTKSVEKAYPTRTFSVEGSGDIDVTPDIAKFSATVISEGGKNVAEVQTQNTEKMNKINAFLKENGVEAKDLKTAQYNVNPRYSSCDEMNCRPSIIGYSVTQTLEVKVRDTSKVGDLLNGVVENGANSVSDVRFVVDDNSDAKNEARKEAIAEARKKAEDIAKAGGFRLGKLVTLYESGEPMPYPYGMGGDSEMSASVMKAAPAIEPGTQNTKVNVSLTFEILR